MSVMIVPFMKLCTYTSSPTQRDEKGHNDCENSNTPVIGLLIYFDQTVNKRSKEKKPLQ